MTSSSSAPVRAGTSPPSAPPSSASGSPSSRRSTGAASASTSAASRRRRCCATPSSRTSSRTRPRPSASRSTARSRSTTSAAFTRSRKVADGRVKGVHFLMKKNDIDEFDGRGAFTDAHTLRVTADDGWPADPHASTTASSPPARPPGCCPAPVCSERVVTYEEQILTDTLPGSILIAGAGAIGVEFAYVLHNYGVEVTIVEFLDRVAPARGRGGLGRARQALQAGSASTVLTATRVESIDDSGEQGHGHRHARTAARRRSRPTRCCRRSASQPRVEGYGLEKTGVRLTDRGAIDDRRLHAHQRADIYAIGDVTAQADARARRRGDGRSSRPRPSPAPRRWSSTT